MPLSSRWRFGKTNGDTARKTSHEKVDSRSWRAEYGTALVERLEADFPRRFGRGFSLPWFAYGRLISVKICTPVNSMKPRCCVGAGRFAADIPRRRSCDGRGSPWYPPACCLMALAPANADSGRVRAIHEAKATNGRGKCYDRSTGSVGCSTQTIAAYRRENR